MEIDWNFGKWMAIQQIYIKIGGLKFSSGVTNSSGLVPKEIANIPFVKNNSYCLFK